MNTSQVVAEHDVQRVAARDQLLQKGTILRVVAVNQQKMANKPILLPFTSKAAHLLPLHPCWTSPRAT